MHGEVRESQEIELLCDKFWRQILNFDRDRKLFCVLDKAKIIKYYIRLHFYAKYSCMKFILFYVKASVKLLFICLGNKTYAVE